MTSEYLLDIIFHRPLPNGGWLDFWVANEERIGQFIRQENLKPARPSATPALIGGAPLPAAKTQKAVAASLRILDPGIRGGNRLAHLHFDGKIYMLNQEQWTKFSGSIMADAKAKLAKVSAVNFNQAMNVAQAVDVLA